MKPFLSKPSSQPAIVINMVEAKNVLTPSRISGIDYSLNPYVGCAFGCRYCYADFMRRFSGHSERWGEFVDVKTNAPERLARELPRRRPGVIGMSLVTDPYQPLEEKYGITRHCLEILADYPGFSLSIQTRSPLVLRDVELLRRLPDVEVGLTVTTDDDAVRRLFEPRAPAIHQRLDTLRRLKAAGLRTFAFIGPMLPMRAGQLARELVGAVDYVWLDRMNYPWKVKRVYQQHHLEYALAPDFFSAAASTIESILTAAGIECRNAGA